MDKLLNAATASANNEIKLYEHNQLIYNEIIKEIDNGGRSIGYTEATGLGKSYVFMKLVNTLFLNRRVLYIAPKLSIQGNLLEYKEFSSISRCVSFATYASFNSEQNAIDMAQSYDVIFADECHHLQSDIQGNNIRLCMSILLDSGGYVFGMTATPESNNVNTLEEYFNKAIYGYDMIDAIEEGILPKLNYHVAVPDDVEIPDDLRQKYSVDSTKSMLEQVLEKYNLDRWIVFFTNQKELFESKESLSKLLPNHEVIVMCTLSDDTSDAVKRYNSTDKPVILLTVSMVLEGVHLREVQGIIIYRNVTKTNVWLQVIGRVYKAYMKYSPVIIDVTSSIKILNKSKRMSHKANELGRPVASFRDIIEVASSSFDTIDFLEELLSYSKRGIDYRGIKADSIIDAMRKLGKDRNAYYRWKSVNEDRSLEMYIDYVLDKIEVYRGLSLESYNHIFNALNIQRTYGYNILNENNISDKKQFVDYALDILKLSVDSNKAIFTQNDALVFTPINYRGISAQTGRELSIKLGHSPSWYSNASKGGLVKPEELIDEYLDSQYIVNYKGYKACNKRELSILLGRDKSYVGIIVKRYPEMSYEDIIDYALENPVTKKRDVVYLDNGMTIGLAARDIGCSNKYIENRVREGILSFEEIKSMYSEYLDSIVNVEYRGIIAKSKTELSDKLGITVTTINRYQKEFMYTLEDIIDAVYDGEIRVTTEKSYRGLTWSYRIELDKIFGFREGYISQKYRKMSDEEIIDKVFKDYPEIKSKFE